jgi:protein TonB
MLAFLLLQAATSDPIVVTGTPRPQALFAGSDYPREALRHGWQGDVTVDMTVGIQGRVTGCTIIESSGHEVLDETTCKIVTDRARFLPARDSAGNPVESHYQTHINWRLSN